MMSKRVLDALREQFHEDFGELSERDGYIQRMKADAFALIGRMAPYDRRLETDIEDAITDICYLFFSAGLLYRPQDRGRHGAKYF